MTTPLENIDRQIAGIRKFAETRPLNDVQKSAWQSLHVKRARLVAGVDLHNLMQGKDLNNLLPRDAERRAALLAMNKGETEIPIPKYPDGSKPAAEPILTPAQSALARKRYINSLLSPEESDALFGEFLQSREAELREAVGIEYAERIAGLEAELAKAKSAPSSGDVETEANRITRADEIRGSLRAERATLEAAQAAHLAQVQTLASEPSRNNDGLSQCYSSDECRNERMGRRPRCSRPLE